MSILNSLEQCVIATQCDLSKLVYTIRRWANQSVDSTAEVVSLNADGQNGESFMFFERRETLTGTKRY
jgi:hypothetical protein